VDYAKAMLVARRRRDARIAKAKDDWRRTVTELAAERDAEIRRLAEEGLSSVRIAAQVGSCRSEVHDVLHPDRRARYNDRRRKHWRRLRLVA
jgi:hypothetical protein